jgi:nitrite reductase/ring-hydroxylating ferredoxin subunit
LSTNPSPIDRAGWLNGRMPGSAESVDPARPERSRPTPFEPLIETVESAHLLDRPGKAIGKRVRSLLSPGPLKDALSGTWLGHALHPPLTDVVIGSFASATALDLLGGDDDGAASERLIALGIAAYGPTALTGINDWADTEPADDGVRRAGLVHAAANSTALALYAASLAARRRGSRRAGVLLGVLGAGALGAGGFLGGHLSFAKGVGPDQTAFDPGPTEWTRASDASAIPEGRPTRVVVEETPVLLLRDGERAFAIHDRCSHRGCSLSEGDLEGGEIVCACHGSRFALSDGSLRGGPATAPQPAFEVRERDGTIEVRRRTPDPL